ncbi:sigma-70 family RNA polymerase sigma factor [Tumebacillus sp. ITR2]|uniref:Sigma-70 family RNA polymerase sigma factor n=1 Tax=Tumebacillus amylolyticus TaxID=2801339 RepID=A0ABS1JG00_9BACL|nr:sigma-70 family RNA polymerase sigma factor [Tumebacillus amylolyticus]MBL0389196.1 sigma-70 family RNA polymerase sigma factor [Tumebacillus amylolyticus]
MNVQLQRALLEEEAMDQLLNELEPFVYRVAFHLTRHQQDAEDLTQEVLYRICKRLSTYRSDCTFQSWVYTMTLNLHRDFLRKKKSRPTEELPDRFSSVSFEGEVDTRILIHRMLEQLPQIDQHIVLLRFQNDLTVREVAQIMDISESNVKTRIFRLRNRLKSYFDKGGEPL